MSRRVKLKWLKSRRLDLVVSIETDLKAAFLLKYAIKRTSTGYLTANSVAHWRDLLGLTVPVVSFMRSYSSIFDEFCHPRYLSLPCFRLTDTAIMLDSQEQVLHQAHELDTVERLCRVLMMTKSKMIPLQWLRLLKWDLGLPDDFDTVLIEKYPDYFRVCKASFGHPCLQLSQWHEEFEVSALQRNNENRESNVTYYQFLRGRTELAFPMSFPRSHWRIKKTRTWMKSFQKLPYISPYQDSRFIDPHSDIMEKRIVGVMHELLNLTVHKKTRRFYFIVLGEELNFVTRYLRYFTRYAGIFYLSRKCKTNTVVLKEGYDGVTLLNPHPLARFRRAYFDVMATHVPKGRKTFDARARQEGFFYDQDDKT